MGQDQDEPADADGFEDTQVLNRKKPPETPLVVLRASVGETFAFWVATPASVATIGRGSDASLVIADPSVSRFHARVSVDAVGALTIEDLGSTNGTFVNQEMADGAVGVNPGDRLLVGAIPVAVERMSPSEVEVLRRATRRLGEAARDSLTGLQQRGWLEVGLSEWVERHRRGAEQVCCLFADIDHFGEVNRRHLHSVGDRVLREVAGLVRKAIRDEDVAVRYGGDEMVVFLARSRLPVGVAVAERIRNAVSTYPWEAPLGPGEVTLSLGIAQLRSDESIQEWLNRADRALYLAKERRNCAVAAER